MAPASKTEVLLRSNLLEFEKEVNRIYVGNQCFQFYFTSNNNFKVFRKFRKGLINFYCNAAEET